MTFQFVLVICRSSNVDGVELILMDIKLIRTQSWHAFITKSSTGAPRPIWHKALLQFKLYWRTSLNAVHFLDNFAKLWFLCQLPLIKWSWTLTNIHWKVMSQTRQNLPGEGCGGRGVQNTYGHLVPPSWLPFSAYLYLDLHLLWSMTKLKEHSRKIC